jgi:hypothetical protein
MLEVAAIVQEAVADLGVRPVVVGGLATSPSGSDSRYRDRVTRRIEYETWRASRAKSARRVTFVDSILGAYERERPRDPDEAEFLRRIGARPSD